MQVQHPLQEDRQQDPPVVTRALVFVYERQYAWAGWGTTKSEEFGNTNGTRQGSVLSPALFTVYVQECCVLYCLYCVCLYCVVYFVSVCCIVCSSVYHLVRPA